MTILTSTELRRHLEDQGFSREAIITRSKRYALVSESWVKRTLAPAWEETKRKLGISRFVPGVNECSRFADGLAFYAATLHIRRNKAPGVDIAVSTTWYTLFDTETDFYATDPITGYPRSHQANLIVCRAISGEIRGIPFEPQTSKVYQLHPKEVKSCHEVRF